MIINYLTNYKIKYLFIPKYNLYYYMAVIKISNKKLRDYKVAFSSLRLGRKISQQETLDLCLKYSTQNFEEILALASTTPMLNPERAEKIIKRFERFKDTPYNQDATFNNPEDNDIYLH